MSALDNIVLVLGTFVASSTTAFTLEFLFPPAVVDTTADGVWIQLIGAMVQWWLYYTIVPTFSMYLTNEIGDVPLNLIGNSVYLMCGFYFMPNCINKFTNWASTIQSSLNGWLSSRWTGGIGGQTPTMGAPDILPSEPAPPTTESMSMISRLAS